MVYTEPPLFAAGAALTAAQMNAYVRDNFKALGDAWTAYTPTWASSATQPVLGNGTLTGAYMRVGKLLAFRIALTMGSTTTYGTGTYQFTLPATPRDHLWPVDGFATDASASNAMYPLRGFWSNSNGIVIMRTWPTTAGNPLVAVTPATPFTFTTSDSIHLTGLVELA